MESIDLMTTTISISEGLKEKIRILGRAGDSYENVIERMYNVSKKQMLLYFLYDESDALTLAEARKRLKNG